MKAEKLNLRICAYIIDSTIISVFYSICKSLINSPVDKYEHIFIFMNRQIRLNYRFDFLLLIIFSYYFLFDFLNNGNSIGKIILNIKVVTFDNKMLTLKTRLIRTILKSLYFSLFPLLFLHFIYAKTILYDKLLNTKTI